MYRKHKKIMMMCLTGILAAGLSACGQKAANSDNAVIDTESTEAEASKEAEGKSGYKPTEENENKDMMMNRQPESSYWHPATLLEWDPLKDEDIEYNISTVPLAKRVENAELTTVNATQNKDTKVMAISIMNSNTSGNSPHGLNKVDANTFSYWQYVDLMVYWGGSAGEGLIVAPSPDVVDAGHKNGVKVIGTVFMPQTAHGGKMEWLEDLLKQEEDGSFPVADKLIEVATIYGFDGWFINQETEGTDEEPLTKDHADRMQKFIAQLKEKAPELEVIYYDSMTNEGEMDWQNALTEKNLAFVKSQDGKVMADDMFLNFWWTDEEYVEQELVKSSRDLALSNEIDPYSIYAGVDVQSDGYDTDINWNLFENPEGGTYTSLGIYCPNWTYSSSNTMQDFWKKENKMWVNSKGDPSAELNLTDNTKWRGVSTYVVERTAVTELPFITNFSTGNGYSFFKNGEQISLLDWNNRSISDVMPTYRYMIEDGEGNKLTGDLDVADAYYGGNSLLFRGNLKAQTDSTIKMYSAKLPIGEEVHFSTTAKAEGGDINLTAVLDLEDGSQVVLEGDKAVTKDWTTVVYDASQLAGKTVKAISYRLNAKEDIKSLKFRFGNITIAPSNEAEVQPVENLTVVDSEFDEDAMYAGVRLKWESKTPAAYYEVYRINQDKTKSLLGVSNNSSFYINTLPRTDETNSSVFEVIPVNYLLQEGTSAQVTMEWPDNSIPKAGFTADVTLIAPGGKVNFTSKCTANTEKVSWILPGSDKGNAEGESISVTYAKEGIYDVSVKAENESGKDEKIGKGTIVVTEGAKDGLKLLSQGVPAEADTFTNENEAPSFAVDGDVTTKWCATGSAPHEITLDLGEVRTISSVKISHAEAGDESPGMNTKAYSIETSEDGTAFTQAVSITKNTAGTTEDAFAPVKARFVKVIIQKPTQGTDSAARIYEVEVYGLDTPLETGTAVE